jgi:hypothetical protein
VELRVYRDDRTVVLRCPGDARCRTGRDQLAVELPLPAVGRYRVVRFASREPLPTPAGGFDADLAALRDAQGSLDEATVVVE